MGVAVTLLSILTERQEKQKMALGSHLIMYVRINQLLYNQDSPVLSRNGPSTRTPIRPLVCLCSIVAPLYVLQYPHLGRGLRAQRCVVAMGRCVVCIWWLVDECWSEIRH